MEHTCKPNCPTCAVESLDESVKKLEEVVLRPKQPALPVVPMLIITMCIFFLGFVLGFVAGFVAGAPASTPTIGIEGGPQ